MARQREIGGDEQSRRDVLERALHTVDERVICGMYVMSDREISFLLL